jgi:hypothetical protein
MDVNEYLINERLAIIKMYKKMQEDKLLKDFIYVPFTFTFTANIKVPIGPNGAKPDEITELITEYMNKQLPIKEEPKDKKPNSVCLNQ